MNRCTEVHHVRAARGPRTSPRTPNARNAPRLGHSHGSPIPAAPAASVSRSRRRRSRLRARARGRARSIPTACRPRTTSAPPPLSPQGSCPVSASSSSRGLTRRGRSLGIPQRSQRNAEREDGPGGVVLRRLTGRVGGDRGRRQRLGRRRVGRLRLDLRGRGLRGRCSVGRPVSITVVVSGCVVVVDSVTVVVDADVVPGDVSVGLGRVGSVTDPVGRVTLLSGGSPEPSPPQPPRR